ncbi:MAG: leucine-rich repeat domain-containing protein [Clostridia bacterium]|nr:leucine-rich repeat domain-containing protein [Clostridia bacterium]
MKIFVIVAVVLALVAGFSLYISLSNRTDFSRGDVDVLYTRVTEGDFTYTVFSDYTCEITDYSGEDEVLRIPSKINTCPVVGIGDYAFEDSDKLIKVIVPSTVSYIEYRAFAECALLKTVRLPSSLEYIGDEVFFGDDCLECIRCSGELTFIGNSAFENCDSLETAVFAAAEEVGERAFYGCHVLSKLKIKKDLSQVGNYAFAECRLLKTFTMPDGVRSIGIRAFDGCESLVKLVIPDTVTSIGRYAFSGTPWKSDAEGYVVVGDGILAAAGTDMGPDVVIPDSVRYVGDAFEDRSDILTVAMSVSVTEIGDGAFRNCTKLSSVNVPASVTKIGAYAFYGCSELENVTLPGELSEVGRLCFVGTAWAESEDFVIGGRNILFGCNAEGDAVTVPDGVVYIADAFYRAEYKSVVLPDSVEHIFANSFRSCEKLEEVVFGTGLISVGDDAFNGCSVLKSVEFFGGVETLGDNSFYGCIELESVSLPESVEYIGEDAFAYCDGITSVVWNRSEIAVINDGNSCLTNALN